MPLASATKCLYCRLPELLCAMVVAIVGSAHDWGLGFVRCSGRAALFHPRPTGPTGSRTRRERDRVHRRERDIRPLRRREETSDHLWACSRNLCAPVSFIQGAFIVHLFPRHLFFHPLLPFPSVPPLNGVSSVYCIQLCWYSDRFGDHI